MVHIYLTRMLRFDSIRGYQFVCSFLLFYSNPSLNSIGRMTLKKFSLRPSVVTRGVFFTHPKFHKKKKNTENRPLQTFGGMALITWPLCCGAQVHPLLIREREIQKLLYLLVCALKEK